MYSTASNIREVLQNQTKKKKKKTKQKVVTFEGISSDDEENRTARGTLRRKQQKLLKQQRKVDTEKRKLENKMDANAQLEEGHRRARVVYELLRIGNTSPTSLLVQAYNEAVNVLARPDGPSQSLQLAFRKDEATDYLDRWQSLMNAYNVQQGTTIEETLTNFRTKYQNQAYDTDRMQSSKKGRTLRNFCKDGWTKFYLRLDVNDWEDSSGDGSRASVQLPHTGQALRGRLRTIVTTDENGKKSELGRNVAEVIFGMNILTFPSDDGENDPQNQPALAEQNEEVPPEIARVAENDPVTRVEDIARDEDGEEEEDQHEESPSEVDPQIVRKEEQHEDPPSEVTA